MKKFLLLLLFLMAFMAGRADVTHVKIVPLTGDEITSALAQIGKIVLGDQQICLYGSDGSELGCTPFSQIGKIVFLDNGPTGLTNVESSAIQVFMDPAQESLTVRGIAGAATVRIYSMQGQLLQSAVATNGEANVSVDGLQNGAYLLQVGAQVVKFIKE